MNLTNCFLLDCCPLPTAMTTIPPSTCPENIGQIQRYFFVRSGVVVLDTVAPYTNATPVAAQGDPTDSTIWNALFTALDDSKIVRTPLIGGDSTLTAGTPVTFGSGDNSTLNGEVYVTGINPSDGTARFDSLTGEQITAFRGLLCNGSNIEVFLISQEGLIWGSQTGNLVKGFDCSNVVLGSMTNNGFGTRDANTMTFQMPFDWDETKSTITPSNFNALTI